MQLRGLVSTMSLRRRVYFRYLCNMSYTLVNLKDCITDYDMKMTFYFQVTNLAPDISTTESALVEFTPRSHAEFGYKCHFKR
jgi:hypothetical protein